MPIRSHVGKAAGLHVNAALGRYGEDCIGVRWRLRMHPLRHPALGYGVEDGERTASRCPRRADTYTTSHHAIGTNSFQITVAPSKKPAGTRVVRTRFSVPSFCHVFRHRHLTLGAIDEIVQRLQLLVDGPAGEDVGRCLSEYLSIANAVN